jgi:hypothetical protein
VLPRKDEMRRRKKVIRESGTFPDKWTSYKNENLKLKAQSGLKLSQVLGKNRFRQFIRLNTASEFSTCSDFGNYSGCFCFLIINIMNLCANYFWKDMVSPICRKH